MEVIQEGGTAKRPPAHAQTAQHLGLVSHADLAQLNTGMESGGQILNQLSKVHTAVRGKIKQDLGPVKGVFHLGQVHIQLVFLDLLQAHLVGALLFFSIFFQNLLVSGSGNTQHRLEGCSDLILRHLFGRILGDAAFHTSGGLYYHQVAFLNLQLLRVKIICFAGVLKPNAYHFCHNLSS